MFSIFYSQYFLKVCHGHQFKYVAHPSPKENYFVLCVPGRAIEMTCDYGECFDEKALGIPCSKVCKSNTTAVDQDTRDHCNDDHTEIFDMVHHENDCESYYLCIGKNLAPMLLNCPPEQYFSVEQKICTTKTEPTCMPFSELCEKNNNRGSHPLKLCYMYYECTTGKTKIRTCSYGHKFDENLNTCIRGSCEEDLRQPNCKDKSNGYKLAHKKCNKYYECTQNIPVEKECPNGNYFDAMQHNCLRYFPGVCTD